MLGGMQHWPLRITRLIDHGEREHGTREIVSRWAAGNETRTTWAGIARDSRRLASALERLGIKRGDRVATLAMNHSRHLVSWYGTIGMGGIIHTINPRLFDDQDRKSTRLNSSHANISHAVFCLKKKTKTICSSGSPP